MEIRGKLEEEKEFFKMKLIKAKESRAIHAEFVEMIKPEYLDFGFKFLKKQTYFYRNDDYLICQAIDTIKVFGPIVSPSISIELKYSDLINKIISHDCSKYYVLTLNHLPARFLKNTDYDMVFENDFGQSYHFNYFLTKDNLMSYVNLHNKYFYDVTVPIYNLLEKEDGVYKYLRYILLRELDMYNQPIVTPAGNLLINTKIQFIALGFDLGIEDHKELVEKYLEFLDQYYGDKEDYRGSISRVTRFFNYFISK